MMNMNNTKRKIILYTVIGFIITAISGVIPVMSLIGATHYGLPFPWITRLVLHPDIFPWRIMAIPLCVDIIFWGSTCYLLKRQLNK